MCTAALLVLVACGGGSDGTEQAEQQQQPALPDGELAVDEPWVRPTTAGGNSALYMTLLNGTSRADTLLDVTAPIIDSMHVHESTDTAGTASMQPVGTTVPVAAQSRVVLEPGGTHVMLINLSQPLAEGESIVLNLEFAQAGLRRVRAPIQTQPPSDAP